MTARWTLGVFILVAMCCGWPESNYKRMPFDQPYNRPTIIDGKAYPCDPPCCVEDDADGGFHTFPESCWQ